MGSVAYGKVGRTTLEGVVFRHLGSASRKVMSGPRRGFDNALISLGGERVMVMTTDPVSVVPSMGMEVSAWLSVHLIASDCATSGIRPELAAFNFNFPAGMRSSDRDAYLAAVGEECGRIGVAIVAGHTGSYPGAGYTVVGGGCMLGFGKKRSYLDPSMAVPGNDILMTKGAAIEAAAYLANSFPRHTESKIGRKAAVKVRRMVRMCSVLEDALAAASVGKGPGAVTSMHDATEGGVLGGLEEMADASAAAFMVEEESMPVAEEVRALCAAHGLDPLTSLSEGTLLITCNPSKTDALRKRLSGAGIRVFHIGSVKRGRGLWVSSGGGEPARVRGPADGYWSAYTRAFDAGLR